MFYNILIARVPPSPLDRIRHYRPYFSCLTRVHVFFLFFRSLFWSCSASTPPHWGPKTIKRDLRQSFFLECLKSRGGILRQKDENLNPTRWVRFLFILCYLWGIESARRFPWKLSFRLLFSGRFALAFFFLPRILFYYIFLSNGDWNLCLRNFVLRFLPVLVQMSQRRIMRTKIHPADPWQRPGGLREAIK